MLVNIKKLKHGQRFKFCKAQLKWRIFNKYHALPDNDRIPTEDRGKLLVIYNGCRQAVISPEDPVIVEDQIIAWEMPRQKDEINLDYLPL